MKRPAPNPPKLDDAVWNAIGTAARSELRAKERLMLEVCGFMDAGKSQDASVKLVAAKHPTLRGASYETLRVTFRAWARLGNVSLVNHQHCGTHFCGLPTCKHSARNSALSDALLIEWVRLSETNESLQTKGVRSLAWGYRRLWESLFNGAHIPNFGDWRTIWRAVNPALPAPAVCPWSHTSKNKPRGFTYSNFNQRRGRAVEMFEIEAAQRGMKSVVLKNAPPVRRDFGAMNLMSMIQIDDWKHDKLHLVRGEDGKPQVVRIGALMAIEGATRRILAVRLYPFFTRKDGTRCGIMLRHTQHLLADVFSRVGAPKHWECELWCENATAAIPESFENLITRTFPNVKVMRQGLHYGDGGKLCREDHLASNSNAKGLIEGLFNILNIELGAARGQTGSNYTLKGADTDEKLLLTERTIRQVGHLVTDEQLATLTDLDLAGEFATQLHAVIHELHTSHNRELEGFQQQAMWTAFSGDKPKPMNDKVMAMMAAAGPDWNQVLFNGEAETFFQSENVMERWSRLYSKDDFTRLSELDRWMWWLDSGEAVMRSDGSVLFKQRGQSFEFIEFKGSRRVLTGETVKVFFDADDAARGAVLQTLEGNTLGTMSLKSRWRTAEEREAQLGAVKQYNARLQANIGKRHGDERAAMMLLRAADERTVILEQFSETLDGGESTAAARELAAAWDSGTVPPDARVMAAEEDEEALQESIREDRRKRLAMRRGESAVA